MKINGCHYSQFSYCPPDCHLQPWRYHGGGNLCHCSHSSGFLQWILSWKTSRVSVKYIIILQFKTFYPPTTQIFNECIVAYFMTCILPFRKWKRIFKSWKRIWHFCVIQCNLTAVLARFKVSNFRFLESRFSDDCRF